MKRRITLFSFFIMLAGSIQPSQNHQLEQYRKTIDDMYQKTLSDPQTSWPTKLWMRTFPVKVIAADTQSSTYAAGLQTGLRTIELNLKSMASKSPKENTYLMVHEFMHYKHAHCAIFHLIANPLIGITCTAAGYLTAHHLKKHTNPLRARYHQNLTNSLGIGILDTILSASTVFIPVAAVLVGWIGMLRLWSRYAELQADASAVKMTKDFSTAIKYNAQFEDDNYNCINISTLRGIDRLRGLCTKLTYPSPKTFVQNIVRVAAADKLQELVTRYPGTPRAELQKQATQWAQTLAI